MSVIECGGKNSISYIAKITNQFGIKTYVLVDSDAKDEVEKLKKFLSDDFIFIQEPEIYKKLKQKMGI
ncbi:MAG: TOPRIM nucleotidyl transferase/hydrolase domain-containing protein [bacterium]